MKIALFGATGKTGTLVLNNLLAKSYTVTALVRTPAKITITSPKLKLIHWFSLMSNAPWKGATLSFRYWVCLR